MNAEATALVRVLARGAWSEVERFAGADFDTDAAGAIGPRLCLIGGSTTMAPCCSGGVPQGSLRWPAPAGRSSAGTTD